MPWQALVADVGLELLPDGRPAYREVTVTVPRQSGKTTLVLSVELQRALGWAQILGVAQKIAYSAQTGKDAREKLLEDQVPMLERHHRLLGIQKVTRAMGSESVLWRNGSRLSLLASSEDSGHGKTLDLGVKDELFADVDMRRDQAMNPAMATRPYAQLWTASTMGTVESLALNLAVEKGRQAVVDDRRSGVAYFEWAAGEAEDPEDPATWWGCMPALGRTITLEVVEHAFQTLQLDEFRRAYTNVMTANDKSVIPQAIWRAVCEPEVTADNPGLVLAFDINPERSAAAIVACGAGPTIEVVDYRPGVSWLVDRIVELKDRYRCKFAVDKNGPGASFVEELTRKRVRLIEHDSRDMIRGCANFYDTVTDGQIHVRANADLDAAVAGADRRQITDSWVWGRKSSKYDISLLVAATASLWAFANQTKASVISLSAALEAAEADEGGD